jgi:hypothetical protein
MYYILYSGLDLFHKCSVNQNAYRYRVLNEMFVPQRVVHTPSGFLLADVWKYSELFFIKIWRASSTCEKGSYRNVLTSHLRYAYFRELSNYIAFLSAEHTSICSLRRALQCRSRCEIMKIALFLCRGLWISHEIGSKSFYWVEAIFMWYYILQTTVWF